MDEEPHVAQAKRRLGKVLCGKYTVDGILGVGGMAVVYRATHRNNKQVAIKMLHAELSVHADIRKRFLREGYVANSVKHKNAVDVIDDDVAEDGAAFLVMELLDGAPVDAIAQRLRVLPPAAVTAIGIELCSILAAAHESGIIHRDIKPANLFITREGDLKVLDFGIARLRDASSQATNTGVMMGTPSFMAPEQARGMTSELGACTDVWAVGSSLFTLLTGAFVHEGDTAQLVMIKVATTQARSILSLLPNLPRPIADIIDRALRLDMKERWESATAMRDALLSVHRQLYGSIGANAILSTLHGDPNDIHEVGRLSATLIDPRSHGSGQPPPPQALPGYTPPGGPAAAFSPPQGAMTPPTTTNAGLSNSFVKPIVSGRSVGLASGLLLFVLLIGGVFGWKAGMFAHAPGAPSASAPPPPSTPEPLPTQEPATSASPGASASPAATISAPPLPGAAPVPHSRPATKPEVKPVVSVTPPPPPSPAAPAPAPRPVDPGSVR